MNRVLRILRGIISGIALAGCLALFLIGEVPAFASGEELSTGAGRQVSFIPHWMPQAQFAGYYVAYEKGFYTRRGLYVTILRGGPDKPSEVLLAKGTADFGSLFLSSAIVERAKGVPLVNLGQIVRKSSQLLIARRSSAIAAVEDMNGKKVGLWGEELSIGPTTLFRNHGIQVTVVPQAMTVNLFLRGGVDVVSAMWYNEYHTIFSAGVDPEELVVFRLSDYGADFPEDGLYCMEDTFKKDPRMCCDFVQASIEGWRWAFDHPEEALDIAMKYVNEAHIATNRTHQKWMLDRMHDIIAPDGAPVAAAFVPEDVYSKVAGALQADGLIDNIPAYSDFFVKCEGADEK